MSSGSITSRDGPIAVTLQPACWASKQSASNDDGVSGRGGELTVTVRFNDDVPMVKREIDELNRRKRLPGVDDPAHGHGCHELKAFIPGQLLRSRAVRVRSSEDAGS